MAKNTALWLALLVVAVLGSAPVGAVTISEVLNGQDSGITEAWSVVHSDNLDGTWSYYLDAVLNETTGCGNADSLQIGTGGSTMWGRVYIPVNLSTLPPTATIINALLNVTVTGSGAVYPVKIELANETCFSSAGTQTSCLNGTFFYPNDMTPCDSNEVLDTEDLNAMANVAFNVTDAVVSVFGGSKALTFVMVSNDEVFDDGATYVYPPNVSSSCDFDPSAVMALHVDYTLPDNTTKTVGTISSLYKFTTGTTTTVWLNMTPTNPSMSYIGCRRYLSGSAMATSYVANASVMSYQATLGHGAYSVLWSCNNSDGTYSNTTLYVFNVRQVFNTDDLNQTGAQVSGFMTNTSQPLGNFIINIGLALAIIALIAAIVMLAKNTIGGLKL